MFTIEKHHQRIDKAVPGDFIGMNIKGLDKNNMPKAGDVMVYKSDTTLFRCYSFTAQVGASVNISA